MAKENKTIQQIQTRLNAVFEKIGTLSKLQRILICVVTFALILGGYYFFFFAPKHETLSKLKKTLASEEQKLQNVKRKAAAIMKYEKMMLEKQAEFNQAMGALPDKRELPSLLTGISRAGNKAGLEFHLFQPEREIDQTFYKEIPVSIKVAGRYHQITDFFFQVKRLNRIVNIQDVSVKRWKGKDPEGLEMSCKAVTYMFVERKEPATKKKSKRKRKQ